EGGICDSAAPPPAVPPRPLVQPLSPDRYRIQFTGSERLCDKLRLAQDLLRHAVPSGDPAEVIERGLDVLIQAAVRQKYAATERPRPSRGHAEVSRHVPAEVKRTI